MRTLEGLDAWVHLRQTKTGAYSALVSRGAMHRALPQRGLMASSPRLLHQPPSPSSSLKYFRGYSHPKSEGPFTIPAHGMASPPKSPLSSRESLVSTLRGGSAAAAVLPVSGGNLRVHNFASRVACARGPQEEQQWEGRGVHAFALIASRGFCRKLGVAAWRG